MTLTEYIVLYFKFLVGFFIIAFALGMLYTFIKSYFIDLHFSKVVLVIIMIIGISVVCTPFLSLLFERIQYSIYGNDWYSKSASVNVYGEKKYVYPVSVTSENLFYYFCWIIMLTVFVICMGIVLPIYNYKYKFHYTNTSTLLVVIISFIIVYLIWKILKKLINLRR
jgi:hypothetical protein